MSTHVPIQAITLSSSAATVTFTGIPQTYTDLTIMGSCGSTSASFDRGMRLQFNNDTSSVYSDTDMYGEASITGSFRRSNQTQTTINEAIARSGNYSSYTIDILNYARNTTNKTVLARGGNISLVSGSVGLWRNTSAITSISMSLNSDSFASGSTFTLYGIGTGSPKAFGGTTVVSDGTYWYHAFQSSGIFEPLESITADVLITAGGGGGGSAIGGGGGAGGVLAFTSQSLLTSSYVVTVGSGGSGAAQGSYGNGTQGGNSQFASLTACVGGGWGSGAGFNGPAGNGGSGGGGNGGGARAGGTGTSGQGNNGASSVTDSRGGGGGGYASAGSNATGGTAATTVTNWGSLATVLTTLRLGVSNAIAGGGGAGANNNGANGSGGGGGATSGTSGNSNCSNAIANTGSGGGGGGNVPGVGGAAGAGGNGGSGLIIVRYPV